MLALGLATFIAATAGSAEPPRIADLAWLSGCWASEGGEAGSGEVWTEPHGGTLLGIGRTVEGGRTVTHEFMRIHEIEPGKLAFTAQPAGQAQATFALLSHRPGEVVFENLEHDFPQRVIYRLAGSDRLVGRIEGMRNGQLRAIEFPARRVRCPGSS